MQSLQLVRKSRSGNDSGVEISRNPNDAVIPKSNLLRYGGSGLKMAHSIAPWGKLNNIQFGMGNAGIRQFSAVNVNKFSMNSKRIPAKHTINDNSLGSGNINDICVRCRLSNCECGLAFGHIELATPVYLVEKPVDERIMKVLICTCAWCSSLLIPPGHDKYEEIQREPEPRTRLDKRVHESARILKCPSCSGRQFTYRWNGLEIFKSLKPIPKKITEDETLPSFKFTTFGANVFVRDPVTKEFVMHGSTSGCTEKERNSNSNKDQNEYLLSPVEYFRRTTQITDEHARFLNFNPPMSHPRDLVQHVLAVLDKRLRLQTESLSKKYHEIGKVNQELKVKCDQEAQKYKKHYITSNEGAYKSFLQDIQTANQIQDHPVLDTTTLKGVANNSHDGSDPLKKKQKTASTLTAVIRASNARQKAKQLKEQNKLHLEFTQSGELKVASTQSENNIEQDRMMSPEESFYTVNRPDFDPYLLPTTRDLAGELQWHVATLINDAIKARPPSHRKFKAVKTPTTSIRSGMVGKEGFFRGTWASRRTDFSSRGVIIPDETLEPNGLGVPRRAAMKTTTVETLNAMNEIRLKRLILNGPEQHPGANSIEFPDGRLVDLKYVDRYELAASLGPSDYGLLVNRHIKDGDIAVFNRQPSLHRMSMMRHKVRIDDTQAYRMNTCPTGPYNADFDGDAMVTHIPQSLSTRIEVDHLMGVECQALSPQSSQVIVCMVQDKLTGGDRLTRQGRYIEEEDYLRYFSHARYVARERYLEPPSYLYQDERGMWRSFRTGKQLFSTALPKDFHFTRSLHLLDDSRSMLYDFDMNSTTTDIKWNKDSLTASRMKKITLWESDDKVLVMDGRTESGVMTAEMNGKSSGGVLHKIALQYPPIITHQYLDSSPKQILAFMDNEGCSSSVGDCFLNQRDQLIQNYKQILKSIRLCPLLQEHPHLDTDRSRMIRERVTCMLLDKAQGIIGKKLFELLPETNRILQMVKSGAKGNEVNIFQIIIALGQQFANNQRINLHERMTAHHPNQPRHYWKEIDWTKLDSNDPANLEFLLEPFYRNGLILNSFTTGMSSLEAYSHMTGGLEGVSESHTTVQKTGYTQRVSVKALESSIARYDFSVRDSELNILQYNYGEDGFDASQLENHKLGILTLTHNAIDQQYSALPWLDSHLWTLEDKLRSVGFGLESKEALHSLLSSEIVEIKRLKSTIITRRLHNDTSPLDITFQLPVDMPSIIFRHMRIQQRAEECGNVCMDVISCSLLIRTLNGFIEKLYSQFPSHFNRNLPLELVLRSYLCCKNVLLKHRMTPDTLQNILCDVASDFIDSLVAAGEMVGTISAQMLGQLFSQGALNTFKTAGSLSFEGGSVGSLQAIIDLLKNPRSQWMRIWIKHCDEIEMYFNVEQIRKLKQKARFNFEKYQNRNQNLTLIGIEGEGEEFSLNEQQWYQKELTHFVADHLQYRCLRDIVDTVEVVQEPFICSSNIAIDQEWVETFTSLLDHSQERYFMMELSPIVIRYRVSNMQCEKMNMTIKDIMRCIEQFMQKSATADFDTLSDSQIDRSKEGDQICDDPFITNHINRATLIPSPLLMDETTGEEYWILRMYIHPKGKLYSQFMTNSAMDNNPEKSINLIAQHILRNTRIRGIPDIKNAVVLPKNKYIYNEQTGDIEAHIEYMIETEGSNLIRAFQLPFIDTYRSYTNNLLEMESMYGILGTPGALRMNCNEVVKAHGKNIDQRHLACLISSMVHYGELLSFRRHDRNHIKGISACEQMTFEEPVAKLLEACMNGETDPLNGPAEALLFSKKPQTGTGALQIVVHPQEPSDDVYASHVDFVKRQVIKNMTRQDVGVLLHNSGKQKVYKSDDCCSQYDTTQTDTTTAKQGVLFDSHFKTLLCQPTNNERRIKKEARELRKLQVEAMFSSYRQRQLEFRKQIKHKNMMESCREQFHPKVKRKHPSWTENSDDFDEQPAKKPKIPKASSDSICSIFLTAPKPISRSQPGLQAAHLVQAPTTMPRITFPFSVRNRR